MFGQHELNSGRVEKGRGIGPSALPVSTAAFKSLTSQASPFCLPSVNYGASPLCRSLRNG